MLPERNEIGKAYPRRPSFFAHKYTRLLTKSAIAQDIGPEACWLLAVVAHQEDVLRYRKPVRWFNCQLLPLCGFNSEKALARARQKAVNAGLLHYEPGRKRKPGLYWCLVSDELKDLDDGPMDESTGLTADIDGQNRLCNGRENAGKTQGNGREKGDLLSLTHNPTPRTQESARADEIQELADVWNTAAASGTDLKPVTRITDKRRRQINTRIRDRWWSEHWRDGIRRIQQSSYLTGSKGFVATFDWLIKSHDNLVKVIEGNYDDVGKNGRNTSSATNDGETIDADQVTNRF